MNSSFAASHNWTSALNQQNAGWARSVPMVRFYDTTLRDGEQTVGVVFTPEQKIEIAGKIDQLGVARIEAGFPRVSPEDADAIRRIQKLGLRAEIWGFGRAAQADLDALVELGVTHTVLEIPASAIKLRAYGMETETARRKMAEGVRYAVSHGIQVAFFPVDATRANMDYLRSLYESAAESGAQEAVIVDTIGACGPEATEYLVRQVREWLGESVPLHYHGHNDFGLATSCAIAAVRGGATWIQGTINGMGERAGNADIAEVAMALHCLYGVPVEMNLGRIREVSSFVARAGGYQLDAWKPVVGRNLFVRESGAVASQFHIPEAIEPFSADLVGARREIVLGKKSGLDSIALKASALDLDVPTERRKEVLEMVKARGLAKRGLVSDEEFREIVTAICAR
jgi:isopropylmalate/homocitrate/citramalate synthase